MHENTIKRQQIKKRDWGIKSHKLNTDGKVDTEGKYREQ